MSLRAEFDEAAIELFDSFGDLIENATLTLVGVWNPVTETSATTNEQIRVSIRPVTKEEADGEQIMVGDTMATAITSEVTATPKIDDQLTLLGVDYLVRLVEDNHGILWKMGLRRV